MFQSRRTQFETQRFAGYRPGFTEIDELRRSTLAGLGGAVSAVYRSLRRHTFAAVFCLVAILAIVVTLFAAPTEVFEKSFWFSTPEDIRTLVLVFASIGGAAVATIALWFSSKRMRAALDQSHIAQENHYTDLLVRAGEQVSNENMLVRMVGIHSLERVARHSKQDQPAVVTILAQFLQQALPAFTDFKFDELKRLSAANTPARGDVEAAINSLSRTMVQAKSLGSSIKLRSVILPSAGVLTDCENWEFSKCAFVDSELDGVRFHNCTFDETAINGCSCNLTWLSESTFEKVRIFATGFPTAGFMKTHWHEGRFYNVYFGRSYFNEATFVQTHFTECDFHRVDFRGARFIGATFTRCDFSGAYLEDCDIEDVEKTFVDCVYHESNPPFLPKNIPLKDQKSFIAHSEPNGVIKTNW